MSRLFTNDAFKLCLFAAFAFLLAALLTPVIYNIGQFLAEITANKSINPLIDYLGKHARKADFARYFNRSLYLATLILLPLLLLSLDARKNGFFRNGPWSFALPARSVASQLGQPLRQPKHRTLHLLGGFFLAAGLLLLTGFLLVRLEFFQWVSEPKTAKILTNSLTTGAIVALIEEFLFRGILLGIFFRALRPVLAIVLLSLLFACLHFMQPPDGLSVSDPEAWTAGFEFLGLIASRFLSPISILFEFTTLFIVGLILAATRFATASLWLPIGLHAGWVFALLTFNGLTDRTTKLPHWTELMVGQQLTEGLVPLAALSFTGLVLYLFLRSENPSQISSATKSSPL
ncbi:MAG: CPBP family intramembrane glutamic endopeptidase [Verrucomicrobiota bacterium]